MAKKIYDIRPPKLTQKEVKALTSSKTKKTRVATGVASRVKHKKEKKFLLKPVLIVVSIAFIAVCAFLFFKLPKADITVWPKVDTLSFKQTIIADKSADLVDLVKIAIPAKYFEETKTNSQDFPATGSASNEGKASGTIIIYNKYDPPSPFTFRAGTRFLSDSGKLFVTFQKVVIPAAKKVGSKITPGSVQINVQAAEAGDSYNIAPSNFSVPGLKGTAYYYSIYATSGSAMAGGYTGKVKKVTDDDILGAKDVLTKKTTDDAVAALRAQIPADYILLGSTGNPSLLSNVTNASTKTKAGAIVDNFNYSVTVTVSALAIKKSDLDQFARQFIISKMPEGKTLLDNSLQIDYSASVVDVSGGKATLNLDLSSGVYQNIDKKSLVLSLLGKNANQISQTISSSLGDQVSKVKTKFWPFWVFSAPNNDQRVSIDLKFE